MVMVMMEIGVWEMMKSNYEVEGSRERKDMRMSALVFFFLVSEQRG